MADNEHKTVIRIVGDVKSAIAGLSSVRTALVAVRSAVMSIVSSIGIVTFAFAAFKTAVNVFKTLNEFINRTAIAAGKLRFANVIRSASDALDSLTRKQRTYNGLLKDELDSLSKAGEIRALQKSGDDYVASRRRDFDRARELAGTNDEREKILIRQRWRKEDERREIGERIDSTSQNISDEMEKSAIYGSKKTAASEAADQAQKKIDDLRKDLDRAVNDEQRKQIQEKIDALKKEREANLENAKTYEKEEKMAEMRLNVLEEEKRKLEEIRDAAGPSLADLKRAEELEEYDRKRQEEEDKEFEEKQKEARGKQEAAREFEESAAEEADRRRKENADELGGYADSLIDVAGSRGNRLTAMGLGDGSSGTALGTIQSDVHNLVELFKQNIEATKNIRIGAGGAVFAE